MTNREGLASGGTRLATSRISASARSPDASPSSAGGGVTATPAVEPSIVPTEPVPARGRRFGPYVAAAVLLVLVAVPLFLAPFATTTLTRVLVFALLAPQSSGVDHLKALALVSRTLRDADLRAKLRANDDPVALHAVLAAAQDIHVA